MSDRYFIDTNILVYAYDRAAGVKRDRAQKLLDGLWSSGAGVLSTQVLQELCVNLMRKVSHPLPVDEIRTLVRDYSSWEIVTNNSESILRALEAGQRYRISFWDALIVDAAERCGAAVLYSEDLAVGQQYGSVQVVNPLL